MVVWTVELEAVTGTVLEVVVDLRVALEVVGVAPGVERIVLGAEVLEVEEAALGCGCVGAALAVVWVALEVERVEMDAIEAVESEIGVVETTEQAVLAVVLVAVVCFVWSLVEAHSVIAAQLGWV